MSAAAVTAVAVTTAAPDLESFAGTGLLWEVAGHPCIAGTSTDPADGRVDCLVEYAPEPLLTDPSALALLVHEVMAGQPRPRWRNLVVRSRGEVTLPAPMVRDLTHLVLDRAAGPGPLLPPGISIAPSAGPGADARVGDWLRRAVADGNSQRGLPDGGALVDETVDSYLAAPDRVSLIASLDTPGGPRPIAHATLLTGAVDEVYGTPFVDLVDILVDEDQDVPLLTRALVAASARHAADVGLPLVGNVVHGLDAEGAVQGERVVASLIRKGWQLLDTYWRCPLDPEVWESP